MYAYEWDSSTGGYILTPMPLAFSKEPRPVYYKELDILGFDKYWDYYPIYLVTVFIDLILEVLLRRRLYKKEEKL